jgi:hypothetical protein
LVAVDFLAVDFLAVVVRSVVAVVLSVVAVGLVASWQLVWPVHLGSLLVTTRTILLQLPDRDSWSFVEAPI